MANPLPNEDQLYEQIKNEHIEIHPVIWELLNHHIANDLSVVIGELQSTVLDKEYPKPLTKEKAQKVYERAINIKKLMDKLKKATGRAVGF